MTEKSHCILRAKLATLTVDKSSVKMPKTIKIGEFFKNLKLAVKTVLPDRTLLKGLKFCEKSQT